MKIQKKKFSLGFSKIQFLGVSESRFKMWHSIAWTVQRERHACQYFGKINLLHGYHLNCILDNYLIQQYIPHHKIMPCSNYLC